MSDSSGRFFEGLLIGGVVGYLFGMLSAPKSGQELRKQIADSSEDFYKQASDSLAGIKDKTGHTITDLQSKGSEALKRASGTVQDTKEQIANKLQDLAGRSTQVLVDDVSP